MDEKRVDLAAVESGQSTVDLPLAAAALERHLGFDLACILGVARALSEADMLPRGRPRHAPQLELRDIVALTLGLILDVPRRELAHSLKELAGLAPDGLNAAALAGGPESVIEGIHRLDQYLIALARHAIAEPQILYGAVLRVSSAPIVEARILWGDGELSNYVTPGHQPMGWMAHGNRRLREINLGALATVVAELFGASG